MIQQIFRSFNLFIIRFVFSMLPIIYFNYFDVEFENINLCLSIDA